MNFYALSLEDANILKDEGNDFLLKLSGKPSVNALVSIDISGIQPLLNQYDADLKFPMQDPVGVFFVFAEDRVMFRQAYEECLKTCDFTVVRKD